MAVETNDSKQASLTRNVYNIHIMSNIMKKMHSCHYNILIQASFRGIMDLVVLGFEMKCINRRA